MDESPMSHALGAVEFAGGIPLEEQPSARAARRAPLPWRTYTRCLLLAAVVGAVGLTAFRPALLRLSILMSLVSPERGDSLAWKPEPEEEALPAPVKFTPPPAEWRLSAGNTAGWLADRRSAPEDEWRGSALGAGGWKRESFNPWDWADDAGRAARRSRIGEADSAPAQKAVSSFRASEARDWAATLGNAAAPAESASAATTESSETATGGAGTAANRVPVIAPLAPLPAIVHSSPAAPVPPLSLPPTLLSVPQLPPLPAAPAQQQPQPLEIPTADTAQAAPQPIAPQPAAPQPSAQQPERTISPAEALSAAFAAIPAAQPEAPATPAPPPAPVDWKEREITEAIPGAYLTIYPKLKFIGLCVPGQGYIRKYNQIAVPMDLTEPKQHAADGRTPYGKYYVAGHLRDAAGPRVVLSWPSVEDARRSGVGPEMLALVEDAWSRQAMPPQDSFAGGGLSLAGDRASSEYTSGGFSLEAPHMEEIFTALPDGAWVFVQQ